MGRIEDMLIARHLFGLDAAEREVICRQELGFNNSHVTAIYDPPGPWVPWSSYSHPPMTLLVVPGGPGDYVEVEHYSTTWAGMGLVIEAMGKRGYMAEITIYPDGTAGAKFRLFEHRLQKGLAWEDALTVFRAVALAALMALGAPMSLDSL